MSSLRVCNSDPELKVVAITTGHLIESGLTIQMSNQIATEIISSSLKANNVGDTDTRYTIGLTSWGLSRKTSSPSQQKPQTGFDKFIFAMSPEDSPFIQQTNVGVGGQHRDNHYDCALTIAGDKASSVTQLMLEPSTQEKNMQHINAIGSYI